MKIFYKKDFQRVLEEKYELKKEFEKYKEDSENIINKLQDDWFKHLEEKSKLKDKSLKLDKVNDELKNANVKIDALKDEIKKLSTSKGGLVKENNKLKEDNEKMVQEINDLKAKINDLESDRYLKKTIPSGRTKNTIKTSIRNYAKESRVIKYVKENLWKGK